MIWKPVVGYEGLYEVSDQGGVRRLVLSNRMVTKQYDKPRTSIPYPAGNGYRGVSLSKNNKYKTGYIHRIVLMAFRGLPETGQTAAHLNGNRNDNRLSNLIWATRAENEAHKKLHGTTGFGEKNSNTKITASQVREIRAIYARGELNTYELATRFGVSRSNVQYIVNRKAWPHVA